MGGSPRAERLPKDIGSFCIEKLHVEEVYSCNLKTSSDASALEIGGASFIDEESVVLLDEGFVAGGHVQHFSGKTYDSDGTPEQAGNVDPEDPKSCRDSSLEAKKNLQKCATFPCSSETEEDAKSCKGPDGRPSAVLRDNKSNESETSGYKRSFSLPTTLKLVSAMKGGRAKGGETSATEKLHVKWAADVYDPPVTSVSHTVNKSHQQRPKSRKKDKKKQKQKQKGRSCGNNTDNKNHGNAIRKSSVPRETGSKEATPAANRSVLEEHHKNNSEALCYGMSNQDGKCGSSFLREAVANIHFSTAEAS